MEKEKGITEVILDHGFGSNNSESGDSDGEPEEDQTEWDIISNQIFTRVNAPPSDPFELPQPRGPPGIGLRSPKKGPESPSGESGSDEERKEDEKRRRALGFGKEIEKL